ncbi:hypothetical protein KBD34_02570 [Patescibacteria group bacterium]|nr:hypothetical protein [Patescibacteria group bacterium]
MSDGFEVQSCELSGGVPSSFAVRLPPLVDRQIKLMSGSALRSHVLRRADAEAVGLTCLVDDEAVVCLDRVCLSGCEEAEVLLSLLRAAFLAERSRLPGLNYFAFIAKRYEDWAAGAALAQGRIYPHPEHYTTGRPAILRANLPRRLGLQAYEGDARVVGWRAPVNGVKADAAAVRRWWESYSRDRPLVCVGAFPIE